MNFEQEFYLLFILNLINLVSPGAGCAITIRNSITYGRKAALFTGLGICTSSLIHKGYALLSFALVFSHFYWMFDIIKFLGVGFLIYLAFECFTSKNNTQFSAERCKQGLTSVRAFRKGFLTDLLNPAASLGFLSILLATISPDTPNELLVSYLVILISCSVIWYTLLAVFFSHSSIRDKLQKCGGWLERISGSVFIYLAFRLAFSAIK